MIALLLLQFALLPDSLELRRVGADFGVPAVVMQAVAYQETRLNISPLTRGPGREQCDSLGCRRVCREIGRLQINPCIQWRHPACALDSLRHYASNLRCGAAILQDRFREFGNWSEAIRRYNGSGPRSRQYMREALSYIGWLRLQEEQEREMKSQRASQPEERKP